MRTLPVAVTLSALATSFQALPTQAGPPVDGPRGLLCSYSAASDPDPGAPAGTMTGEIHAGPATWDRPFTIHCTIQVGDAIHNGTSNDSTAHEHASSFPARGTQVAFLDPTQVGYLSPQDSPDYLCTAVSYGTPETTIHWTPGDAGPDGVPSTDDDGGGWSTDPSRHCTALTTSVELNPLEVLNDLVVGGPVPTLCTELDDYSNADGPAPGDAVYVDDDGDVFVTDGAPGGISEARWRETIWWDCPPFVDIDVYPWDPGADGADGGVVVDNDPSSLATARSAVAGCVAIRVNAGDTAPAFTLSGVLAVPALWQCTASPSFVAAQPFAVSTAAGAARTSIHCDADAVPEAQTATASGAGGHSSTVRPLIPPVAATQFRCTVDNGSGGAPAPGFAAPCGDIGAATVEPANVVAR